MPDNEFLKPILLIEDNQADIELALRLFDKCSVTEEVTVATDGQMAADMIFGTGSYAGKALAPGLKLIFLDLNIPKIPGIEVLRRLRLNPATREIPVVALTITDSERTILQKEPFLVKDYLRKPLEMHSFLNLYNFYVEVWKNRIIQ
jgi:two-component system, response regulator